MQKILECIPNFSEGRDKKKIQQICDSITKIPDVFLLNVESDIAHNRSVVTFAGPPEAVMEAAFQSCKKAAELIDLNHHKGEHPRMGATDVIPFVPIKNITEKEAVAYARKIGARIGNELNIPVYLYEKAATKPENQNLAKIRTGEYETIKKEIGKNPGRDPDFGPKKLGTAGAVAVGARTPLVAYNVNLASKDLKLAKTIAKKIRFKDGGFKNVKAMGFELKDRDIVQVSMNLTDYTQTNIETVFNAIKKLAKKHRVKILESEIIGLIPEESLINAAKHYLKVNQAFSDDQILEIALQKKLEKTQPQTDSPTLTNFLDQLASGNPVPGGGSVSALCGSLAAALASMVSNLTISSKKYEKFHKEAAKILTKTENLRKKLYELIAEDSKAYQKVSDAYKLPKSNKRELAIQNALKYAAEIPLKTAETAAKLLPLIKTLQKNGNQNAASDCGVAKYLVETAIKGAILNIKINLKYIKDQKFTKEISHRLLHFPPYPL